MSDTMLDSSQVDGEMATHLTAAQTLIAVANEFTEVGFDVRSPSWGDTSCLRITNVRGARCELSIARSGAVVWDYHVAGVPYPPPSEPSSDQAPSLRDQAPPAQRTRYPTLQQRHHSRSR
ncbi:MAG TPA: hypothetical protein VFQ44_08000 [Streptosporangiaceae bacterium]|nr:hypothetical protein [Streptosporangiaceae bacterium]